MIKKFHRLRQGGLIGMGLLLSACTGNAIAPEAKAPTPASTGNTSVNLTYARSGCLGNCQRYRIEVNTTGEYRLNEAAAVGKLSSDTLAELQTLFRQVRELRLPEQLRGTTVCPRFMTDMATISLTWQAADLRWQLQHNLGCKGFANENELLALEARIGALLPSVTVATER